MEALPHTSNIADNVFRTLRRQILSGELAAGSRLPGERELAAKYNTNRNTLREAVRRLEQSRLVTVRHGQGVTVCDFRRTGTMELLPVFLEISGDISEIYHVVEDILPARLLVLEFATRMAVRRATRADCQRLQDVTELLIAAFERRDPVVIAHGFQRWLEALIDSSHSVTIRWVANPFLDAYRELMDKFPGLWLLDDTFPGHLKEVIEAIDANDENSAIASTQRYYARIDRELLTALEGALELSRRVDE